jgi:hypothetical protein
MPRLDRVRGMREAWMACGTTRTLTADWLLTGERTGTGLGYCWFLRTVRYV